VICSAPTCTASAPGLGALVVLESGVKQLCIIVLDAYLVLFLVLVIVPLQVRTSRYKQASRASQQSLAMDQPF
jgi:hypothetical protein